mmetsp:Transcript_17694/g.40012  ORF Transcript_17694/g.40012 Transcript_17694/m.40012 type:complete len:253 (+) Transcript_17694:36-794(+)
MFEETVTLFSLTKDNSLSDDILKNLQRDRYFSQVIQDLQDNDLVPMEPRCYFIRDGFLFFKDSLGRERICIPFHVKAKFLKLIHDDSCHIGKTKTLLKATQIAFWPNMTKDVARYVNSCSECLQAKSYRQRTPGILHSHLVPKERFEKISVDLLTALPVSKRGNDSVLVFLDQFSNRVFLYPCKKSINSKQAAKAYFETVYRSQGICKILVSDYGSLFSSQFWEELFRLMGIDVKHSSVYHPQSQGSQQCHS